MGYCAGMGEELEQLRSVTLFSSLSDEQLQTLMTAMERRRFMPGQVIIREGEPGDSFHVITSGEVAFLTVDAGGHEITLDTAGVGGWFGELSMVTGDPRSARVKAVERTETLCLGRDAFRRFLVSNPEASLDVLAVIGRRLARADELLRKTTARNVNQVAEEQATIWQKTADTIAAVSASAPFVVGHLIWFGLWIGYNLLRGEAGFDPFPFGLLTMVVSLEAIFLSIFVLVSQNRSGEKDRIAADIDHQVNMKAEQQTGLILRRLDDLERGLHHLHDEQTQLLKSRGSSFNGM